MWDFIPLHGVTSFNHKDLRMVFIPLQKGVVTVSFFLLSPCRIML